MFDSFFEKAIGLNRSGEPFALAQVVRHEAPSSGKPGDKAVIRADGTVEGWIGGGCAQPVVIREAQKALADGKPRLVRIAPTTHESINGIVEYPMTCHSGGTLDVYIEPVFPKPHLVIFGASAVSQALARLAKAIEFRTTVIAPEIDPVHFEAADVLSHKIDLDKVPLTRFSFLIVATQGVEDENALECAARSDAGYVAFVASRKKAAAVFETLRQRGVSDDALARVKAPAGLDIKAKLPEEIAVSILAEVIQAMRESRQVDLAEDPPENEAVVGTFRTETLHIGEMSCAHCIMTVEKTLRGLEGVEVLGVDIGTATIGYDAVAVSRESIVDALGENGYPVQAEV